jgi:transcriptional regulator with XRE-family HTH domain
LANITQQAVSRLERGEVTPRVSTMRAIALALGTNIEVLFPMSSAPADRVAS